MACSIIRWNSTSELTNRLASLTKLRQLVSFLGILSIWLLLRGRWAWVVFTDRLLTATVYHSQLLLLSHGGCIIIQWALLRRFVWSQVLCKWNSSQAHEVHAPSDHLHSIQSWNYLYRTLARCFVYGMLFLKFHRLFPTVCHEYFEFLVDNGSLALQIILKQGRSLSLLVATVLLLGLFFLLPLVWLLSLHWSHNVWLKLLLLDSCKVFFLWTSTPSKVSIWSHACRCRWIWILESQTEHRCHFLFKKIELLRWAYSLGLLLALSEILWAWLDCSNWLMIVRVLVEIVDSLVVFCNSDINRVIWNQDSVFRTWWLLTHNGCEILLLVLDHCLESLHLLSLVFIFATVGSFLGWLLLFNRPLRKLSLSFTTAHCLTTLWSFWCLWRHQHILMSEWFFIPLNNAGIILYLFGHVDLLWRRCLDYNLLLLLTYFLLEFAFKLLVVRFLRLQ